MSRVPVLWLLIALATACAGPETRPAAPELAIGASAPAFALADVDGRMHGLADYAEARALAVVFTCLSCPVARAYEERIIALARDYADRDLQLVAIMPNDPQIVPADAPDRLKARAEERDYPFPFLIDETQAVAAAFGARVTPHVFLFGPDRTLFYRGRIDDQADPERVESRDFVTAIEALLAGRPAPVAATKAFGCSIKWKQAS